MAIQVITDATLLAHSTALHSVYTAAFCAPPWNEDEGRADAFIARLTTDARRPGFTAALDLHQQNLVGFATAWTTPNPFPEEGCYPQAAAGLGPRRTEQWLCGALEINELAIHPGARGTGTAIGLIDAVTTDPPDGRAWLLTSLRSAPAVAFYRRQGWTQATHPAPDGHGIAVFLAPRHPARTLAAQPL
ncbi:GNAT family N-acetyltransferase [Streptomyces sp. NPDC014940]|uniref:GNAT family N-acetyltransferase n=1 Tax=Streptomyces sp. NPDC014940 TaxID=3364932 RepID=UPI0036F5A8D8